MSYVLRNGRPAGRHLPPAWSGLLGGHGSALSRGQPSYPSLLLNIGLQAAPAWPCTLYAASAKPRKQNAAPPGRGGPAAGGCAADSERCSRMRQPRPPTAAAARPPSTCRRRRQPAATQPLPPPIARGRVPTARYTDNLWRRYSLQVTLCPLQATRATPPHACHRPACVPPTTRLAG